MTENKAVPPDSFLGLLRQLTREWRRLADDIRERDKRSKSADELENCADDIDSLLESAPHASGGEAVTWAMTDYQTDGPNTQYTNSRDAAEHYESMGLHVAPLFDHPPSVGQEWVAVPRPVAETAMTVAEEWLSMFSEIAGLEKYERFTYAPAVEQLRDDMKAATTAPAQPAGGGAE